MRTIIIIGDGDPRTNDQNLQAMEFWNYGMKIALWCNSHDPYGIYAPQRVCDRVTQGQPKRGIQEEQASQAPIQVTPFTSVRTLVNDLGALKEALLIVTIGHGFTTTDGGCVELCSGKTPTDRQLSHQDINGFGRCVYLGLHCSAQSFADAITNGKPAFYLTGKDVGQNSDIRIFTDNCKNSFTQLTLQFSLFDQTQERDDATGAVDALRQMAETVNQENGKDVAGQRNTF
jgi:hypothetical protein